MKHHIDTHRNGFSRGHTEIAHFAGAENPSGIGIAMLQLDAGEDYSVRIEHETAWLLMSGAVNGVLGRQRFELHRRSLFDESASCLHAPAGTTVHVHASVDTQLSVYECANTRVFDERIFAASDVANEPRGRGQVGDRALRYVRTIFDRRNSPAEVELVLGEVVTFPGGWSSYPPHHHAQPEIYHYRFSHPQGYGHAELGDTVLKVREYDTVHIPAGLDHAQCAAPGYAMYYSWVIRHLPDNPYTAPEFTAEHAWTLSTDAKYWRPGNENNDDE
jgi:5-deoxy-glucuronate isomerase